jgi:Bacterial extracellular solute-binding protein
MAEHVVVEGVEGTEVGRNGVVVVEAVQHQPQIAPLLRNRQVPHPALVGLDLPELGVQPLANGVPPGQPPTLPGPPEDVGEAQEGEGFRLALSFGSTGQFYTQITQDAPFEVFLAADDERPAKAVDEGFAVPGSQFTYGLAASS